VELHGDTEEESLMSSVQRRRSGEMTPFGRLDRMFDEWFRTMPMRQQFGMGADVPGEELIRVDEYRDGNTQVIKAELPGIDPEKDVELTVTDGMLRINAQRRVEEKTEDQGYTRHELRYGSFTRTLPMPEGHSEKDITATYKDGMLEIRVPVSEPQAAEPTKIAVQKA
jgi:HSP20 family protein